MALECGYRYEATSVEGFVQQLAVCYLKNQYWFYVLGEVPLDKSVEAVDEKLLTRYEIVQSKWAKARAKKRGEAKLQYLRYDHTFILVATHGAHRFFADEAGNICDVREEPVQFYGYSIGYRDGHPHVRIARGQYTVLEQDFLFAAIRTPAWVLEDRFRKLPFEPYGPVRRQLRKLLWKVNRSLRTMGLPQVDPGCLRTRRKTVKPFG